LSVAVSLVKLNALAAGAIRHRLVESPAEGAIPNGQNGKGKSVFAITKVSVFFGLFRHVSSLQVPEHLTRLAKGFGNPAIDKL